MLILNHGMNDIMVGQYINKRAKNLLGQTMAIDEGTVSAIVGETLDGVYRSFSWSGRSFKGAFVKLDTANEGQVLISNGNQTDTILGYVDSDPEWDAGTYNYADGTTAKKRYVTVRIDCSYIATLPVQADTDALAIGDKVEFGGSYLDSGQFGKQNPIMIKARATAKVNNIILGAVPASTTKATAVVMNFRPLGSDV